MVVGGKMVELEVDGAMVVDWHCTSVVELLDVVGPVPVVGGVAVLDVVVLAGGCVVVGVGAVVVVVPGGGALGHPKELAIDANSGAAPGRLAKATCSDLSNPQIGSRATGSSCDTTRPPTTGEDPAAGVPRRSAPHTKTPTRLRRSVRTIVWPSLVFIRPPATRERRTLYASQTADVGSSQGAGRSGPDADSGPGDLASGDRGPR